MLITIVQAEIETAIREYIDRQINLRPGMNVAIDLQATRGAEGFRAIIDITTMVPVKVSVAPPVVHPGPTFPTFTVSGPAAIEGIKTTRIPQSPAEVSQLMADEYAREDATDIALSVAETMLAEVTEVVTEVITETVTETVEPVDMPSLPKSPSLFKNLRKPVNV